jgi:hypothetical protein
LALPADDGVQTSRRPAFRAQTKYAIIANLPSQVTGKELDPYTGASMSLESELAAVRKDVVTDGYDMSIGEVTSLYRSKELIINPEFQRYFRWDPGRKTRFVESILLGIPIPPIFVFQRDDGVWELVDGLQRISTLLEFMGLLVDADGKPMTASVLGGTRLLPSLADHSWEKSPGRRTLTPAQKIDIKRARLRVEILKRESDPTSKFELFQRLNTGGAALSEQEVRNCTMVMIDRTFYQWIVELSQFQSFERCVSISENSEEKQFALELVLRLLAARARPYTKGLDVHEYLDEATVSLASDTDYKRDEEAAAFKETFDVIHTAMGDGAFRRWDGNKFSGKFLLSVYEVIGVGVSQTLSRLRKLSAAKRTALIQKRSKELSSNQVFQKYSGAGVRGTDRMANLLSLAKTFLAA